MRFTDYYRRRTRIKERVCYFNPDQDTDHENPYDCSICYFVAVQVKILWWWVTIWEECCDAADGDKGDYLLRCAEELNDKLNEKI